MVVARDDVQGSLNKRAIENRCREASNVSRKRIKSMTYPAMEILTGALCFHSISYCSEWLYIGAETRVTVSLVPSSVVDPDNTKFEVVDGGTVLELQVEWPHPFQEARKLFKFNFDYPKLSEYTRTHPEVIGMEVVLKSLCQKDGLVRDE